MSSVRGFTLIEVMIVVVIVAILAAVGYPSYREHIARGQRSEGQQVLTEIAQRQEQFLLDRRQYGTAMTDFPGLQMPTGIKYAAPVFTVNNAASPPNYAICMTPTAGSQLANRGDGSLCVNNLGQRWRQPTGGNTAFDAGECLWEDRACKITGES
jgi:type IV pilus assembly protein PilE